MVNTNTENKSGVVQNLEKGKRTRKQVVLKENKWRGRSHKEDGVKCGLDKQTEGANLKSGLVQPSEQFSEVLAKRETLSLTCKAIGRRSRSGPWEVNKELTRAAKLSGKLRVREKFSRQNLKDGRHIEKISVEGSDPSVLKAGNACVGGKLLRKILPNICQVCSAMATKRQHNVWVCYACFMFFCATSKVPYRPCKVNIPLNMYIVHHLNSIHC